MNRICVFCGSSMGTDSAYREAAYELAMHLLNERIGLVYGGANVGLMKILADTMLQQKGEVIGVMPQLLVDKEVAHTGLEQFEVVTSMAERKARMVELSDAFIAMPGGFGTLDELSEILTYNQLHITDKPLGLLNTKGYFDPLLTFIDHGVAEGFIRAEHRSNVVVDDQPERLLQKLAAYAPVAMNKWIRDIQEESQN